MKLRREGAVNERVADRSEAEAPNPLGATGGSESFLKRHVCLPQRGKLHSVNLLARPLDTVPASQIHKARYRNFPRLGG